MPSLGAQKDHIGHADARRIVRPYGRLDREVAIRMLNTKAMILNGTKMLATRNEGYVAPGPGQMPAEAATDASGTENDDSHLVLDHPSPMIFRTAVAI